MWYMLGCGKGTEDKVLFFLRQHLSNRILKDSFVFTYDRMKRYCGQWHIEQAFMFPGYIFLESEDGEELCRELGQCTDMPQAVGGQESLAWVCQEEEKFLRFLCGRRHHLGISRGCIRKGVTHVDAGPLRGMEDRIQKIDRHKRIARLKIPMRHPEAGSILAGLEIVEKN